MRLRAWLRAYTPAEQWQLGQGLVEYAFIIILVGVVLVALLLILGPGIANIYQDIVDALNSI